MTKRTLPQINAFDDLRSLDMSVMPGALDRWNVAARASEAAGDNVISIYGVIGDDFFGTGGVTDKRVAGALRQIGERDVEVHINSPGGDLFQGVAIYNILRAHPHKVTVKVVGLAASAASIVAMAGDTIQIARSGFFMIHNAWVFAIGNRHDLRGVADTLDPFDEAMAGIYAARTGLDEKVIAEMMDKETYIGGAKAVEKKFADELLPADQVKEDAHAAAELQPTLALRQIDVALARQGMPRSKRRDLIKGFRDGTPSAAAAHATQNAGDTAALAAAVQGAIATLQN